MAPTRRVTNLALLVSIGLVLSIIESTFPPLLPVPGAKLGLANIATVIALYSFGPGMALRSPCCDASSVACSVAAWSGFS